MQNTEYKKLNNKVPSKLRSRKGMTMAELLMVVAIIIILMGVAFIALFVHQRNLAQVERDSNAREIFIAAQNHLTMSRGEGYTDIQKCGTQDTTVTSGSSATTDAKAADVYYYTVSKGDAFTENESEMIDVMLPFGSIDEMVRMNGSYIIRYEPETATILDVFYTTVDSGSRFDYDLKDADFSSLVTNYRGDEKAKKDLRKNFNGGAVLGWYGGTNLERLPYDLESPQVSLENGDKLVASITNHNFSKPSYTTNGLKCKLIITGLTSGAKKAVLLDNPGDEANRLDSSDFSDDKCTFVLDSVTDSESHFNDLISGVEYMDKKFIPGEDIKVEAVAYSSEKLCRIRFSEAKTGNSLYESILTTDTDTTAFVSSFRHLENLDAAVSSVGKTDASTTVMAVTAAKQTDDLVWGRQSSTFNTGCKIYDHNNEATSMHRPVSPDVPVKYDGLDHSISNVAANYSGSTGIFGAPASGSKFSNLEIIDVEITAAGDNNAGALAGTLQNTEVENVIAYNSSKNKYTTLGVEAAYGTAGGLIGEVKGGTVKYSAAAVQVSGEDAAGGLIGSTADNQLATTIEGCYAGGHTDEGEYYTHNKSGKRDKALYNVYASDGAAGGLVGKAGTASIKYSYSTCSVEGNESVSGGFIGTTTGAGSHIENCYCTGLVVGTDDNGFIGTGNITGKGYYLEIVNEYQEKKGSKPSDIKYKYKGSGSSRAEAMDGSVAKFNSFKGYSKNAAPYDEYLEDHYPGSGKQVKYSFKTVTELKTDITNAGKLFVNVHHGDWPSPEIFIINSN